MKLRKLVRLCEHDRLDTHLVRWDRALYDPLILEAVNCPGGVFLPDDTLVIESGHEKEVALALLQDAGVLRRRVDGDRQTWQTTWEWSDEYMKQKATP